MATIPKSAEEHARDGTWRADRHGHRVDLELVLGEPTPPGKLSARERRHWRRLVAVLGTTNALAVTDGDAIYQAAILCAAIDELRAFATRSSRAIAAALADLKHADPIAAGEQREALAALENRHGDLMARMRNLQATLKTYLETCGLTPLARGRVKVPKTASPAVNPIDAFRRRAGLGTRGE